jgi:DNA-binding transcriptional regulator YdaS (Cro superfamily)
MQEEQRETYRNTVREALAIVGSEDALALRLRVSRQELRQWIDGELDVPTRAFLDAVDIVVQAKIQQIGGDRKTH